MAGAILFFIALIIVGCNKSSSNKRMKECMKRNDADPNCKIKSNEWYRQQRMNKNINK